MWPIFKSTLKDRESEHKKETSQEKLKYKKAKYVEEYDKTKRDRKFNQKWTKDFEWLLYDTQANKMFCRICRKMYMPFYKRCHNAESGSNKFKQYSQGSLVQGCVNFRLSVLKEYSISLGHKNAQST